MTSRIRPVHTLCLRLLPQLARIGLTLAYLLSPSLTSCGTPVDVDRNANANETTAWGSTAFALTAELGGVQYALRDAEFALAGPEEVLVRGNDYPNDATLVQELQTGQYTLELLPGYRLVRISEGEETDVDAALETPNPQTVLVAAAQVTAVNFLFRVARESVSFGQGNISVGVTVEAAEQGGLLFSEFMVNPAALSDTAGEWVEIANTSSSDVDLNGCTLQRDDSSFTLTQPAIVPAGGFATLSNGPSPGFTPTAEYDGISLPNTAIFVLTLTCNDVEQDTIRVDPASWPMSAGASTSLSPRSASASKNDESSTWCLANTSFGSDFGTPGAPNDACP